MTAVTTPFGFATTADEIVAGVDLRGKRAIVTGGASGIGLATVQALAGAGAQVTIAVRRPEAADAAVRSIRTLFGAADLRVAPLDLADLTSVRSFVADWDGPLHILVNNAGVMAIPNLERTREGREMQFATNFLGHFALTVGLQPALAAARGARLVSVSSSGNLIAPVIFDDLDFDFMPYDPLVAYGQSKSACALMAVEAHRRWASQGIFANALNPGAIATNLQRYTGGLRTPPERQKSPQQGAATSVLLAASPLLHEVGGRYFEDCNEAAVVTTRPADYSGVAHYAVDPGNARRLWDVALQLIG